MSSYARVDSIDALKGFKVSLCKFSEVVGGGLGEAEAEIQRVLAWLKHEQHGYWKGQMQKRAELVNRAKTALNNKKLYKTPTGGNYSTVEEDKAFRLAKKRYEEAEQKFANVRLWTRKLEHEMNLFREQIRGARQTIEVDVPNATVQLDKFVDSLEAYIRVQVPVGTREQPPTKEAGQGVDASPMVRDAFPPTASASGYERLRESTPAATVRGNTHVVEPSFCFPEGDEISTSQRQAISNLNMGSKPCASADKVVLAKGCWNQPRIFLERIDVKSSDDSGWFVGSMDENKTATYEAIHVADLLRLRPDWIEILSLPSGFLVILSHSSIKAVLDDQDHVLWRLDD